MDECVAVGCLARACEGDNMGFVVSVEIVRVTVRCQSVRPNLTTNRHACVKMGLARILFTHFLLFLCLVKVSTSWRAYVPWDTRQWCEQVVAPKW